jgi:hypothetical protein
VTLQVPPSSAPAPGSWLTYFFRDWSRVKALLKTQADMLQNLALYHNEYDLFYRHLETIGQLAEREDAEVQLLTISNCELFEPQRGSRVTQRETQHGGRPFIGTKVGPVFIGGSGRSTSHSTSTTVQMPDQLGHIDSGQFVVSTRSLSFIGALHSRTVKFTNIIASPGEGRHITIASSTRQTVSVVEFPHPADMWVTCILIDSAEKFGARRLDTSGKVTAEELNREYLEQVEAQEIEVERAFKNAYAELEEVNQQLREFAATYPSRVANPGATAVFTPRLRWSESLKVATNDASPSTGESAAARMVVETGSQTESAVTTDVELDSESDHSG